MNKTILAILLITTTLFSSEIKTRTGEFPAKEMQSQNREIVKMVVEEISSTLPQTIDKYTNLTAIKAKETTMVYYFEINTGFKSDETVKKEDKSRMKKAVTKGVCQSAKRFIDADISISYIYLSAKTKAELFKFDISHKDCIGI